MERKLLIVILIISLFILISGCQNNNNLGDGGELNEFQIYMDRTYRKLSLSDLAEGFKNLDESMKDKKVFLLGEYHAIHSNYTIWLEMLKYLNSNHNVNNILIEGSPSVAYILNQFLEDGNINRIEKCFGNMAGTYYGNQDEIDYWEKIYEYNKDLTVGKKLTVLGLDVEFQKNNAFDAINEIYSKAIGDNDLIKLDQQVILKDKDGAVFSDKVLDILLSSLEANKGAYIESLGSDYYTLKLILINAKYNNEIQRIENNSLEFTQRRDQIMHENFNRYIDTVDNKKYFGKFGGMHVSKSMQDNYKPLATILNSGEESYKNSIWSANIFYVNSKGIDLNTMNVIDINSMSKDSLYIQHFLKNGRGESIYMLPKGGSPFSNGVKGLNLPDMYDAIIIIKDSENSKMLLEVLKIEK